MSDVSKGTTKNDETPLLVEFEGHCIVQQRGLKLKGNAVKSVVWATNQGIG